MLSIAFFVVLLVPLLCEAIFAFALLFGTTGHHKLVKQCLTVVQYLHIVLHCLPKSRAHMLGQIRNVLLQIKREDKFNLFP